MNLNNQQVAELVRENRYKVDPAMRFISRCIDGRYENAEGLPALAIAGADAGELAVILASAHIIGEVDQDKAYRALVDTVGGEKNIRLHTNCGHRKLLNDETKHDAYHLYEEDLKVLDEKMVQAKKNGAIEVPVDGDHQEGAVLIVRGDYSVYPQHKFKTEEGEILGQVFVVHQSLIDERHHELARNLIKAGAFKTLKSDDEEYLYTILTETTDEHLFETSKELAKGLPIYNVTFKPNGDFDIKHIDTV